MSAATPIILGQGNIFTLGNASMTLYQPGGLTAIVGYASPNLQSLKGNHSGPLKVEISGQQGQIVSVMYAPDDRLEMDVDFVAQGLSIAGATLAATLPVHGSVAVFTGLAVVQIGRFDDGLNGPLNGAPVWIVEGGSINPTPNGAWTCTLKLVKRLNITSGVPVS